MNKQLKIKSVIDYLPMTSLKERVDFDDTFRSVTSVIQSKEDREKLNKELRENPDSTWSQAVRAGISAHNALETGEAATPLDEAVLQTFNEKILPGIDEVWGQEESLVYPGYFGRFDGVGIYKGKVTLFDYKKTLRLKQRHHLRKYFEQLMAYKQAHEFNYPEFEIEQVAIFNIFGNKPSKVGAKVTILTKMEMEAALKIFNRKLHTS